MNYASDTLKLQIDKCTGCGVCVDVCPHAVFVVENRKAEIFAPDQCMECGACQENCAAGAIQVQTGVGCASAMITGFFRGTEAQCGCDDSTCC